MFEEDNTTLRHEVGQVMFIDFWASWCAPCQKPMGHNQEMVQAHKAKNDWQNVRIIGLSIDQNKSTVSELIKKNGWTSVEHYWASAKGCTAADDWQVTGVPHCILIDRHGNQTWNGHPSSINVEEEIRKLLYDEIPNFMANQSSTKKVVEDKERSNSFLDRLNMLGNM